MDQRAESPPRRRRDSYDRRDTHDRDSRRQRRRSRSVDGEREKRKEHRSSRQEHPRRNREDDLSDQDKDRTSRRHRRDRSSRRHRSHSIDHSRERRRRHKDRSTSPRRSKYTRSRSRSRSRDSKRRKVSRSRSPPPKRAGKPLPSQEDAYRGNDEVAPPVEKQKPNFNQTGLLAKETNTVAGTNIVLKYNEPSDARKPPAKEAWRLYIFKGADILDTVELGSRSCWLCGREAAVADLLVQHPSTSKQHAVIQFRHTVRVNEYGDKENRVRPYLIDLESANGSTLNGERVEPTRYVELMDKDVIKFGLSEREYVMMLPPPDA